MGHTATAAEGVVAVGASAGGIEALTELAAGMPADLPFAVMVVVHMGRRTPSVLASIVDRSGPLTAVAAVDGDVLEAGRIYVAVPDRHLLTRGHRVAVSDGPQENGQRPAIDALLRSVALDYGSHAIGVLMSGLLDDGVAGLRAIKAKGGITVVQDPTDAMFPDLPQHALNAGVADYTVAAKDIAGLVAELIERESKEQEMDPDGRLELENEIAMGRRFATSIDAEQLGPPTGFTCPTCKGALMAIGENTYRCQVGHAWTAEALLCALDDEFEESTWAIIRVLKQKSRLSRKLAESASGRADLERYTASADLAEHAIAVLSESPFAGTTARGDHTESAGKGP